MSAGNTSQDVKVIPGCAADADLDATRDIGGAHTISGTVTLVGTLKNPSDVHFSIGIIQVVAGRHGGLEQRTCAFNYVGGHTSFTYIVRGLTDGPYRVHGVIDTLVPETSGYYDGTAAAPITKEDDAKQIVIAGNDVTKADFVIATVQ